VTLGHAAEFCSFGGPESAMEEHRRDIGAEIAARLEQTCRQGSPNQFPAGKIPALACKYLDEQDTELQRFPELVGKAHWNLWMADVEPEDAVFVVLIFRAEDLEFFCGTGNAYDVRTFAESDFPEDPAELLVAMSTRYSIPSGNVHFSRSAAEKWLGRGW
jgi:hypothetical protein